METNVLLRRLVELRKLDLSHPDIFICKTDRDVCLAIFIFVQQYGIVFRTDFFHIYKCTLKKGLCQAN